MNGIDFLAYYDVSMKIIFPRDFVNANIIPEVLKQSKIIFGSEGKHLLGVVYDCGKIQRISILGVLLIYKIIDYSYNNDCFMRARVLGNELYLVSVWKHYGFTELMNSYIQNSHSSSSYSYLEFKTEGNIIIAPQPLLRGQHAHFNNFLQKQFTPKLNIFFKDRPKVVDMIFGCVSEIIGNFWEHSTDDNSLLVAEGDNKYINISYADTGNGIISTMRNSKQFNSSISAEKILQQALNKGVTSKPKTSHMGYGLWIVDEIVSKVGGILSVYSEGACYINRRGKKTTNKCDYWRGTIISINLPLSKPVTPSELFANELSMSKNELLINFL